MKPSEQIYKAAIPIWEKYFSHPFVQGLCDGSLPVEKFKYYLIQDHKYLMQYAKLFALGVVKSHDESDMRMFNSLISATLDTENALHQKYLAELGVSQESIANTQMALNNKSYTDYMIAESTKGGLPEITASVLACSWSYKVIGDYLEKQTQDMPETFYSRWIAMYTSEEYRLANQEMIDLFDKYCSSLSEDYLARLAQIVVDCSYYEYQFWDMAWTEGKEYTSF